MDPVLEYLLGYNKLHPIEYSSRFIIPVGGLQKMLDGFNGYHLNRIEVTKDELERITTDTKQEEVEETIEDLYALLD